MEPSAGPRRWLPRLQTLRVYQRAWLPRDVMAGIVLTPLLGPADLHDRVERGRVRHVIARPEDTGKFAEVPGDVPAARIGAAG